MMTDHMAVCMREGVVCRYCNNGMFASTSYATSQKVTGSSPDEVDFSIDLILSAALWPWGRLSL
jgi:hypothetical protein